MALQSALACDSKACDSKSRTLQITEQLDALEGRVRGILEAVVNLEDRLTPILRPLEPTCKDTGVATALEELVPIADYLRSRNYTLTSILSKVESLIRRVEV